MKKLLIIVGAVLGLLILAVLVVPAFIPTETYKEQITAQVREATGRTLTIKGDLSLSILPSVALTASDVTLSNAPGARSPQMATLKGLEVEVRLLPLLSGRIEVDRFVLIDPIIDLEIDKNGRANWDFKDGKKASKSAADTATPNASKSAAPSSGNSGLEGIRLGDVRIVNGTIRYRDAAGQKYEIGKANFSVSLPDIESPFELTGDFNFKGQTVKIDATMAKPSALLAKGMTPVSLKIGSEPVTISFSGSATGGDPARANGNLTVSVPSVRRLAALAGSPMTLKGSGMGPFKMAGTLALTGSTLSFSKAVIEIDKIRATGGITVVSAGKVPTIKGALDVQSLDLNPYLNQSSGQSSDKPSAAAPKKQSAASKGWSTEKISAVPLRSVNADLRLKASHIRYQKIKVDRGAITVKLTGGRLTASLDDLVLYKGRGKGRLMVDSPGGGLRIQQSFTLSNLEAQPFLRDAAGTDRLSGRANFSYSIEGAGASQRQIVAGLGGNGSMKFTDGAIRGFNLAAMMRNVSTAALKSGFDPAQKTDFAVLAGTFVIRKGILTNNDLIMQSPLLRVAGKGTVNLLRRTQNYRVEPKVVGSLRGQGDKFERKGVVVPIIVTGTWDQPVWRPDLAAALKINADGSLGSLKDIKKNYKEKGKELLKGLTGKGSTDGTSKDGKKPSGGTLQDKLKGLIK